MYVSTVAGLAATAASLFGAAHAYDLPANPSNNDLITAANAMKQNALTFYNPNAPGSYPGLMLNPNVYYWWQAGGLMGQLIQHWSLTGNDSLNDMVTDALTFQTGPNKDFEPLNQTKDEGNDDQAFWAYAALDAAEYNFPAPDPKYNVSWLGLAQAVFNRQAGRWDTQYCGGGLRWQIDSINNGYNYKNTPANGGFFQIAARLARFTGNQTYADWAEKIWDWADTTGLIGPFNGHDNTTHVFDGFGITNDCKPVNTVQYTYNFGAMLMGAAFMYNHTGGNSTWGSRVQMLINGLYDETYLVNSIGQQTGTTKPSFGGLILSESADEFQTPQNSDNDDPIFKAFTIRWMTVAAQLAPFIESQVNQVIVASRVGAALQCTGHAPAAGTSDAAPGSGTDWCGRRWYQTNWDGYSGFGEQVSAMSVFQAGLIGNAKPPLTANTGGTSVSQPSAGGSDNPPTGPSILYRPITGGDKFGAAVLTILAIALVAGALFFMLTGD